MTFGFASDLVAPKRILVSGLALWLVSTIFTSLAVTPWMLFLAGKLVGAALDGTWRGFVRELVRYNALVTHSAFAEPSRREAG